MRRPAWLNENRTLAAVQIALTLGGAWLIGWLLDKWWSLPAAPLLAIALIVAGLILYATTYLPHGNTRRRPVPAMQVPAMFTPRGQINTLIAQGQNVRGMIPSQAAQGDLPAALVGAVLAHQHLWRVAAWNERTWATVQRSAPALTALYDNNEIPANTYDAMRGYMNARLAELREVLLALP